MSNVICESVINAYRGALISDKEDFLAATERTMALKPLEDRFINRAVDIIIGCLVPCIVGYVAIYRVVSRLWYTVFVVFQRLCAIKDNQPEDMVRFEGTYLQAPLLLCSVIDTASDDIPTGINIGQVSSESRAACCQSQLYVRQVRVLLQLDIKVNSP